MREKKGNGKSGQGQMSLNWASFMNGCVCGEGSILGKLGFEVFLQDPARLPSACMVRHRPSA